MITYIRHQRRIHSAQPLRFMLNDKMCRKWEQSAKACPIDPFIRHWKNPPLTNAFIVKVACVDVANCVLRLRKVRSISRRIRRNNRTTTHIKDIKVRRWRLKKKQLQKLLNLYSYYVEMRREPARSRAKAGRGPLSSASVWSRPIKGTCGNYSTVTLIFSRESTREMCDFVRKRVPIIRNGCETRKF